MGMTLRVVLLLSTNLLCHGLSIQEQLDHIAQRRIENAGLGRFRRVYGVDETSSILGAPRYPNQLPEAEPILPGHTLLRPTLGMLKSAIKFPHKEMEGGAGVYGNTNNILGIRWDGTNQMLAYSGFRRSPSDFMEIIPGRAMTEYTYDEALCILRHRFEINLPTNATNKANKYCVIYFKDSEEDILVAKQNEPQFGSSAWLPSHPYHKEGTQSPVPRKRHVIVEPSYQPSYPDSEENEWESEKLQIKENIDGHQSNGQIGEKTQPSFLDSRLYKSPETLNFVKLMLNKLKEVRRPRRQGNIIVLKPQAAKLTGDDLGYGYKGHEEEYDDDELFIGTTESAKNISMKSKWFLDSKNAFNHIKFNSDAPDHDEHFPANAREFEDDPKKWWYFHQSDFQPFTVLER